MSVLEGHSWWLLEEHFFCLNQYGEFNFGLLTATHQAALSLILLSMTGQGNMRSTVCQNKDRELTHQLLTGQTRKKLRKIFLICCKFTAE